ncbi:MAG: chorismate mutase, partial [Okeania sp. SIO2H7]|nr:chorismate mutase [Okeania sp. SIO2H7]
TSAQAKAVPDAPDVRMTTCKVRLADSQNDSQTIYLYQEQAMSANLGAPYRQRFLRLAPSADGQKVESASFKTLDPKSWVGLCQKPQAERTIRSRDMESKHCSVFLVPIENGFLGNTQPGGCPTNFRGAVKITNTIRLNATGMDTLDRGFDGEGNLIWGAKERPYQFRKSN